MKKKILVTGGAGYIGSKISYDLTDLGYEVFIIDNLSTGYKKLINPRAHFYYGDILNFDFVNNILKKNKITSIIHLAASLSVEESQINPFKYYRNNVEGTYTLLKAAVNNQLRNFIFSSTCAVYGNIKNLKVNEETFCHPESYYGKTKLLAELIIKNFSEKHKFTFGILRYFNVVGADKKLRTGLINKNDQLFKNLSFKLVKNKNAKVSVYGRNYPTKDGTCIRDYISVNDISTIHILTLNHISKSKKHLTLNCGYGFGFSVLNIIKKFSEFSKKKIKITFKSRRAGDIAAIIADNKLMKKIFGTIYKTSLKDIINSCLMWERLISNRKKIN
jgi:UDP-glucose 4-epimerase